MGIERARPIFFLHTNNSKNGKIEAPHLQYLISGYWVNELHYEPVV